MSNIVGPHAKSSANGSEVAWRNEGNGFEIMTWTGYSPATGSFRGTLTRWAMDDEAKEIHLLRVSLRLPYEGWLSDFTNPGALVPDSHKRRAREIGRERFDKTQFRKLIL